MNEQFYNAERKIQYMEYVHNESTIKILHTLFRRISDYEQELDLDIADFRLPDLIRLFEEERWHTTNTFTSYRWMIGCYIDWCIHLGYCDAASNPAKHLKLEHLSSLAVSDSSLHTLEELTNILNVCYGDSDDNPDPMYVMQRSLWYLAWFGFSKHECVTIKKNDLTANGIETDFYSIYDVPENVMNVWRNAVNVEEIQMYRNTNQAECVTVRKFSDTPYLLRSMNVGRDSVTNTLSIGTMDNWAANIKKLQKQHGFTQLISVQKLNRYGTFSRLREWEENNAPISSENRDDWEFILRKSNGRSTTVYMTSALLRTYNEWKKAFYA